LREKFLSHGIELNTSDINFGKEVLFEIHMDVHKDIQTDVPVSLFQYENEAVHHLNLNLYEAVVTWDDSAVMAKKYHKFYLPISDSS
jgi:hypothetical protein